MVMKHKRAHLNVPQFVIDEWKSKDQNTMAHLLMEKNWDKAYAWYGGYIGWWFEFVYV